MTKDERRLLELLADSQNGASEALLLAHGFSREAIAELLHAKFAATRPEQLTFAARSPLHIARVRITDAGRRALAR